jgi:putative (di)nucleoside polyphosphate hydrolase
MASSEHFRAGVGIVVIDSEGRVLGLERSDAPGSWQLPQGGIEAGEESLDAARRELEEETGIRWDRVELLAEYPSWLGYELPSANRSPKTGRGQVHRWFLVRFTGHDSDIRLNADVGGGEFGDWRWMRIDALLTHTWEVRRPVYESLGAFWSEYLT